MDPDPDLTGLRKEMNDLRRSITVEYDEDTGEPQNINIRCCILSFVHPDAPSSMQMLPGVLSPTWRTRRVDGG